jgi:hypothetical protein
MENFAGFPKIHRISRRCIVSEKIDGTNAQIFIDVMEPLENIGFFVGSKTRWITPEDDNHGFAKWAYAHKDELISGLGPGRHFGEWWGSGIQRNYGLKEKRFSLFNTIRWVDRHTLPSDMAGCCLGEEQQFAPECCYVAPIIATAQFDEINIPSIMTCLAQHGSYAVPGFLNPEGIVIYHIAGNVGFKKTFKNDEEGKGGKRDV